MFTPKPKTPAKPVPGQRITFRFSDEQAAEMDAMAERLGLRPAVPQVAALNGTARPDLVRYALEYLRTNHPDLKAKKSK